jgi:poly-gamma-glutamate synthesis protein (capsule biosynthesis protein)
MVFNAPRGNIKGLVDSNFKVLSLANNHALDQGVKGLNYTLNYLDENKIQHAGAGKDLNDAWQPAIVEAGGIKICFVAASYASVNDNGKTTNGYVARIEDIENLKLKIENSKKLCDFVVASMHAGTEYTRNPNADEITFAHAAIDDGADMVIGGHPHWIQTTEKYQGKYIFYSLGNFIFDQDWSQDTKEGLALKIQVSKNQEPNQTTPGAAKLDDLQGSRISAHLDSIELIPVIIENYSTPRPATADEAKKILEKIGVSENTLH